MRTRIDLVRLLEASGIAYETVESGRCWMIVAPSLAARIMGAGSGDENAFWVPPAISTRGWSDGGNAGGQRTWIAPESGPSGFFVTADGLRWEVAPELDPGTYGEVPAPAGWKKYQMTLSARSADGSRRQITLARSMSIEGQVDSAGTVLHIRFQHELGNAGSTPLERVIGLWSIIQLPCEEQGVIFFAVRPGFGRPAAGRLPRPYFGTTLPPVGTGNAGRLAWMPVKGGTRFKAGMSPSDFGGTIGFVRRARLPEAGRAAFIFTTMSWEADPSETYVDHPPGSDRAARNGDTAQAYCDAGTDDRAFCEIESHAPAPLLAPGEAEAQDIEISIAVVESQAAPTYMSENLGMEPLPEGPLPG